MHGRWSYKRVALVIMYFFYKNVVYTCTLFWFNLFAGFSGQRMCGPPPCARTPAVRATQV